MPHILNAVHNRATCVVILSNNTGFRVALHYCKMFQRHDVQEIWFMGGIGDTTRYIPVHTLATKLGNGFCKVLPALHILTGCDYTSKVGTEPAVLRNNHTYFCKKAYGNGLANVTLSKER